MQGQICQGWDGDSVLGGVRDPALLSRRPCPTLAAEIRAGWTMRRLMLGSLLAVATAALLIPVFAPTATNAATLERIETSGTVRLGFREDARPYSFKDSAGKPAGYIVDLCRDVVERLKPGARKLKTEFVRIAPNERFEAVREGRIDILCDPASVTMERRAIVVASGGRSGAGGRGGSRSHIGVGPEPCCARWCSVSRCSQSQPVASSRSGRRGRSTTTS